VGKGAEIPAGARIGTNVMIEIGVREADYSAREIPSGATVRPAGPRAAAGAPE
jgi:hypothetical protein